MFTGGNLTLTNRAAWNEFVAYEPLPPPSITESEWNSLSGSDRVVVEDRRCAYHSDLPIASHPALKAVHADLMRLLRSNQRMSGARPGLAVSGKPNVGKSTVVASFGRTWQRTRTKIDAHEPTVGEDLSKAFVPVVFFALPENATPKSTAQAIVDFLGVPVRSNPTQAELVQAARTTMLHTRTSLVIVDEIHNLRPPPGRARGVGEVDDFLKQLANSLPATFVYIGIDLEKEPVMSGAQTASRFGFRHLGRFPLGSASDLALWRGFVKVFDDHLRLFDHPTGLLHNKDTAAYLWHRTQGSIGSLANLLRQSAVEAIISGEERVTLDVLERIQIDKASTAVFDKSDYAKQFDDVSRAQIEVAEAKVIGKSSGTKGAKKSTSKT